MVKKSDYVTKKDLVDLEERLEIKLGKQLEEKLDVKFGEYFEIMITSVQKTIDSALGLHKSEVEKTTTQLAYEAGVMEGKLQSLDYKTEENPIGLVL
ncbi:MAG: hypothetical protein WAV41_00330 [Microgenomates group bacterium]